MLTIAERVPVADGSNVKVKVVLPADATAVAGADVTEEIAGREENIVFSMPKELRIDAVNV